MLRRPGLPTRVPRVGGPIRGAAAATALAATLAFAAPSASADPSTITFYTMKGWLTLLHEAVTPATDPYISDWAGQWVSGRGGQQWEVWIDANDGEGYAQCHTSYDVDGNQWDQRTNPPFQNPYSGVWNCSGDPTTNCADLFYLPTQNMSALANGAHTITAVASDDYGGVGSAAFQIFVDNTLPSPTSMSGPVGWRRGSAVVVSNATTAGPSGIRGQSCGVGGSPAAWYSGTSAQIPVSGDGDIEVDCTAQNAAYVNGPRTGFQVLLDNSPPGIAFEPQNPNNPTGVVVGTGDSESGVAGGSIQIAPAGTGAWASLPTSFDGAHLLANLDDAGLRGRYTILANSCDNVGNCASTEQTITLPVRIATQALVGFTKIHAPSKIVRKRVLVGWHYRRVRRHHHLVRVRAGGRHVTVRLVIHANATCEQKRIRTGSHRWRMVTACRPIKITTKTSKRVAYSKPATVSGLLLSAQGVPLARAPVQVQTAPNNGLGHFTTVAVVTTSSSGVWSAPLAPGPSRIIRAVYPGSPTMLPASGQATMVVPARIKIKITPTIVPWGSTIRITGRVLGGYVPTNSTLLRLNVGIGRIGHLVGLPKIDPDGRFVIVWKFDRGQGVLHPWFSVGTLRTERTSGPASRCGRCVVDGHFDESGLAS